jgi:beta-glucosidase
MQSSHPNFVAPNSTLEAQLDQLLSLLSMEEKITLLGGQHRRGATFPIERLRIPEFKMSDGPMGVHWWCTTATAYPALFCLASSFDEALMFKLGESLGRDCLARGVHILLAPGVNLYRSPLCGRNFEYAGEDPYLAARTAVGFIRGVQSQGVCATVKHFFANFQEYDRHHVSSDIDERTLHEIYLPAFEAAVKEAGVGALMTGYNLVNGVHCSEDAFFLKEVLKGRWGFQGLVMSDWVSVYSDAKAINAGLDLEMPSAQWFTVERILPLIAQGTVTEATIDDKVRRLLRLALCFGWLDREQLDAAIPHDDPASRCVALDVARGGIVLLKNEGDILPINAKKLRKIAVLGPYSHPAVWSGGGSAFTTPASSVSVLEGLRRALGETVEILHSSGPEPNPQRTVFSNSRFFCDLGEGLQGDYYNNGHLTGEPTVTRLDEHLNFTWGSTAPMAELTVELYSARWHGAFRAVRTGRYLFYARSHDSVYQISINGLPIVDTMSGERNGLHTYEMNLESGSVYTVQILWRKTRYWGGMQFGYECIEERGKEILDCVECASKSDVAILCVGFDNVSEGEGFDRPFAMNEQLETLVIEVAKVQPNTIIVLTAGGNVDMRRWLSMIPGLLFVGYPGQEGGTAIAELLTGKVNPSGKLPATFEKRLEDRSSYHSYHDEDHDLHVALTDGIFAGYRYADRANIEPQFCFGFGLSYTQFSYERLTLSAQRIRPTDHLMVNVDVINTGEREGAEVVQLYVRDVEASVERPDQELKAFAKVFLLPKERKTVTLELKPQSFAFYDVATHDFRIEAGLFELRVGSASRDIRLCANVEVMSSG